MSFITARQREVLGLVNAGLSVREMRDSLDVSSTKGVSDHITALIRKGCVEETKGPGKAGRFAVTALGLKALGLKRCSACAGSGTVSV